MINKLPLWIDALVSSVASMFFLDRWTIRVQDRKFAPISDQTADGVAEYDPAYYTATLYFDRDLEPDPAGVETVLHEVLHLTLSDLESVFQEALAQVIGEDAQEGLRSRFDMTLEQTLTVLSRGMAKNFEFYHWIGGEEVSKTIVGTADLTLIQSMIRRLIQETEDPQWVNTLQQILSLITLSASFYTRVGMVEPDPDDLGEPSPQEH